MVTGGLVDRRALHLAPGEVFSCVLECCVYRKESTGYCTSTHWILHFKHWALHVDHWTLHIKHWILQFNHWTLHVGP